MEQVIFEESLSIFQLIMITALTAVGIFIWAFYSYTRRYIRNLMRSPSIIICGSKGCGKTSLIKGLTGREVLPDSIEDLSMSYLEDGGKKIQIIDGMTPKNIRQLKKLNCVSVVYVFDPSPSSEPVSDQIKNFERVKKVFKDVKVIPAINKIDIADRKKLNGIENKIKKFYKISLKTADGLDELKKTVLSL